MIDVLEPFDEGWTFGVNRRDILHSYHGWRISTGLLFYSIKTFREVNFEVIIRALFTIDKYNIHHPDIILRTLL